MSIKDLLVHVDTSSHVEARIDTAIKLAQSQGAHLTGLFVVSPPEVPDFIQAHLSDSILEQQYKALEDQAAEAQAKFSKACAEVDIECDWRIAHGSLVEHLTRVTRYFDMSLLGQRDTHEELQPGSHEIPDRVVLSSGRPAMIVPYEGNPGTVGKNIVICWDASRLATRSVSDTLPLLISADKVTVLVVNTHEKTNPHGGEVTGANISAHLKRHGVNVEAKIVSAGERHIGETVIAQIDELGADSVVMGAWGHQRWREMVLGGLTRYMMKHMTVPVIMSH